MAYHKLGSANAWMKFKGARNDSAALKVYMLGMPTRPHPAEKGELLNIPGRNGKLWLPEDTTYDRFLVTVDLATENNDTIDAIGAWLSGSGNLVFGDEPYRSYHATVTKEFSRKSINNHFRGQKFTVTFDCEPFRYMEPPDTDILLRTSSNIPNPGTIYSEPLLYVVGSDGSISIGGRTMYFTSIGGSVYVDCEAKIAYTVENEVYTLKNHVISGDWIRIPPGTNAMAITGLSSVTITPRWRWI